MNQDIWAAGIRLSSFSSPFSLHLTSSGTFLKRFIEEMQIEEEQSLSLSLSQKSCAAASSFSEMLWRMDGRKRNWSFCSLNFGFIFSVLTTKSGNSAKLFGPPALWNGRRTFLHPPPQPAPLYLWPCTVFISKKFVILGRQRFLVSTTAGLKYVNMYLGQFQWPCLVGVFYFCLFSFSSRLPPKLQDFKLFNTTFGRKGREEKNKLYVNLSKYSKEIIIGH